MRTWLCLAPLLLAANPAPAAPPTPLPVAVPSRKEPVSYTKEVADIIDAKCVGCHSGALAESKLILEDVPAMLKGGKRGAAVVPGKADESLLFRMAAHRIEPVMPPKDKKDQTPLTPGELGLLKLWIDGGAKDDAEGNRPAPKPIELGTLPPGLHPILAVDMTDDGLRVAAGRANVVQVYDADSGLEIASLGGHKDLIQSVRFSPDGKLLAAGSYQVVSLWSVPTGSPAKTFTGHNDQVRALAVSGDGKTAFSGSPDGTVRVWDVAEGRQLRQLNSPGPVFALAVSPDGQLVATGGSDQAVHVLGAADGKERAALKANSGQINDLAFLPDGKRVVSVSADGSGRIWAVPPAPDAKPGEPLLLTGHKGPVHCVAVTPDGQTVATGGEDGTVRLWHPADGRASRSFSGPSGPVTAVAFSPRGDALLIGSADKSARLVDLAEGRVLRTFDGLGAAVTSVAFEPGGARLAASTAAGGLKVWNAADGRGVVAFGHTAPNNQPMQPALKLAFAGEGRLISASADRTLRSWTFSGAWSEERTLGTHVFRVLALDFSPDGKLLASGGGEPSRSGEIKLWEVATGRLARSIDGLHSDTVFGLRFSPDSSKLASAAADKFMKVSNVADGKELKSFEGHTHHVLAVDWKSDGKQIVTGGADNVLKIWDYEAGEQLRTTQPAGKQVTSVRWLPGKPEVLGASGDKLVRLWNADNGGVARTYSGPVDYVFALAASKDGAKVTAGGAEGILFLWNGQNAQLLRKLEPPAAEASRTVVKSP